MKKNVLILDNVGKCYAEYGSFAARVASWWMRFKGSPRMQSLCYPLNGASFCAVL